MVAELENLLSQFIRAFVSSRDATFVVAVSGGIDSMTLLWAAHRVLPAERLIVAHYHHGTRTAADADESLVRETASRLGLRYETERRHTNETSASENALRRDRRAFLTRVKEKHGADFVLLAHHADDQLETFLMRILRGTGIDGLGAMRPRSGIWLRPWLTISRASIEAYARGNAIAHRHDETNFSDRYLRGRVRKLLPSLYELAEPFGGSEAFLARLGGTLAETRAVARRLRADAKASCLASLVVTPWWARVRQEDLAGASVTIRRSAVRGLLARIDCPVPDRDALKFLGNFVRRDRGRLQIEGVEVEISCGYVYFRSARQRKVPPPELAALGLDVAFDDESLELRLVAPGDRLRSTKLKKIWLERRVPRPERAFMPVLAKRGSRDVVWYPGEALPNVELRGCAIPLVALTAQSLEQ